ncbi:hypothetical protein TNCV_554441 [Trichonephila clavipes]|nr:hypothetical protein TNCV_554441 [Trichonephila clavipes]
MRSESCHNTSHYSSTRELLVIDLAISNDSLGQVTSTTPESVHPLQTTAPVHLWEDFELDRFNVHLLPLHGGSSVAAGLESVTHQPRARLTITNRLPQPQRNADLSL